jgi:hypothetical protein
MQTDRSMKWQVTVVGAALVGSLCGCSPMNTAEPALELTVNPRSLRNDGQVSRVTVTATDGMNKPGTGEVRVQSSAGSLTMPQSATLSSGTATVEFSCNVATDMACRTSARLTAEWTSDGKRVEASASITLTVPPVLDAGSDAGQSDGGPPDAGMQLEPVSFDGGFWGAYRLLPLPLPKPVLLAGTGDSLDVSFQLRTNTSGMLPVAMRPVTLTLNDTSFDPMNDQRTTELVTDAMGRVTATIHVRNAPLGNAAQSPVLLVARSAMDAQVSVPFRVARVGSVTYTADMSTRTTLATISTGINFSTPVFFLVRDADGAPIEGVDVDFSLSSSSAAGCTVMPARNRTNAMGLATTTLAAGDSQGTAVVVAKVRGRVDTLSTQFNIVIGRVSEGRMQVTCSRNVLGALQSSTPPRTDQSMTCTVSLADRNGRNPPNDINVSWLAEAGSIPPMSQYPAGATSTTVSFNTAGGLPTATNPLPATVGAFAAPQEPSYMATFMVPSTQTSDTTVNPRDNFVTIVAAVTGEEVFWDGSGSSNGSANGRWDPGEYWVDLPEPFADSNDNGTWDPGEPFIDSDRLDCTTGMLQARNSKWDPPNGCWDINTQVWRPAHVVYSGALSTGSQFLRFVPSLPAFMPSNTSQQVEVFWTDRWFNRISHDNAAISVGIQGMGRGGAAITARAMPSGELSFGHDLSYLTVRAALYPDGGMEELGTCDVSIPDAGYPFERCLRTYKFVNWQTSVTRATLVITAPPPPMTFPDGGSPPATTTTFELRGGNSLQTAPTIYPFQVNFP